MYSALTAIRQLALEKDSRADPSFSESPNPLTTRNSGSRSTNTLANNAQEYLLPMALVIDQRMLVFHALSAVFSSSSKSVWRPRLPAAAIPAHELTQALLRTPNVFSPVFMPTSYLHWRISPSPRKKLHTSYTQMSQVEPDLDHHSQWH